MTFKLFIQTRIFVCIRKSKILTRSVDFCKREKNALLLQLNFMINRFLNSSRQIVREKNKVKHTLIVPLPSPTANTSPCGLYLQQRTYSSQSLQ